MSKKSCRVAALSVSFLALAACANKGLGPQGGPVDRTPPVVLRMSPAEGGTGVVSPKLTAVFDENIQVENAFENVVVSPSQTLAPEVKVVGHRLTVLLRDTLQPNTTYTIDFGESLSDYNEKNILRDFSWSFTTGETLDTLSLCGTLLDAMTLEPVAGAVIGVYPAPADDSTFLRKPLERVTKTDATGVFRLKNLSDRAYRLYALQDVDRNFMLDPYAEAFAFMDETVTPEAYTPIVLDSTATAVDSTAYLAQRHGAHTLLLFTEDHPRQYLVKSERRAAERLQFYFAEPLDTLPVLTGVDFEVAPGGLMPQLSVGRDTLTYWLRDSDLIRRDTLTYALTYPYTDDSTRRLTERTDTLRGLFRRVQSTGRAARREAKAAPKASPLILSTNLEARRLAYLDDLTLTTPTPVEAVDDARLHVFLQRDTLLIPQPFRLEHSAAHPFDYTLLQGELSEDEHYLLRVDSAAFVDIYGRANLASDYPFTLRPAEEYAVLNVTLPDAPQGAVVELRRASSELLVASRPVEGGSVLFDFVEPGEYVLRLFADLDGNGVYTPGDYFAHRRPEPVAYFPSLLRLRANWEVNETWSEPFGTPLWEQKKSLPAHQAKKSTR